MSDSPQLPASCEPHQPQYKPNAWQMYSLEELGNWVHLFTKRALHRTDRDKALKDLEDATNYHAMMKSHIEHARAQFNQKPE